MVQEVAGNQHLVEVGILLLLGGTRLEHLHEDLHMLAVGHIVHPNPPALGALQVLVLPVFVGCTGC